ncbi:nucleotide sugar dehydrogenase [Alphaproteobacteria bacterium]|nr:nucleotide sugar dehydrogenase [Alphaproteobacteria bacterium]
MSESLPVISIIGLGYIGLPLALAFGEITRTIGYDIDPNVIKKCKMKLDHAGVTEVGDFEKARHLEFTSNSSSLKSATVHIIAVPTPIDNANIPELSALLSATEIVGGSLKRGDLVIVESTVWPGLTNDLCRTLLEKCSGFLHGKDFNLGYSPERINPGDKVHSLRQVTKVVSGDNPKTLKKVSWLYKKIITAGVFEASSIEVAEAAKVIENTQRDINIALMNELAIIFDRMGIDTIDVLNAAATKWNFLNFRPGLVGGHCIGVDPYYLTYKAQQLGCNPEIILAGRRLNDSLSKHIAAKTIKLMIKSGLFVSEASVLILGVTFKENITDIRNSKVPEIAKELGEFGCKVSLHDPLALPSEVESEYNIHLCDEQVFSKQYEAVILAVPHEQYVSKGTPRILELVKSKGVIVDVKSVLDRTEFNARNLISWRL